VSTNLARGLTVGQERLYQHSPYFKASIDTLASMLPLWVNGIAARAAESDRQYQQALEALRFDSMPHFFLDLTRDAQRDVGVTEWRDR
jgi:hypothetical protein